MLQVQSRKVTVLVVFALALLVIPVQTSAKTELTLSMWGSAEYWNPIFERFEQAHPDIEIQLLQTGFGEYFDSVLTMIAGGAGPDLIVSNPQHAPIFIQSGAWLKLDGLMQRDQFDFAEYLEAGWAYGLHEGSYYAWPAGIDTSFPSHLFGYNRDMFAQAGLGDLTPDWTFEDMIDYGKLLTIDRNGDGVPEVYGIAEPTMNWYWNWVWSNGGQILSDDKQTLKITEAPAVEALQFLVDLLANKDGISGGGWGEGALGSGNVAIANFSLPGAFNLARQGRTNFDWAIVPYPHGQGGSVARAGDLPLGINSASPNIEAAWTFLTWLVSEETQEWATFDAQILSAPVHRSVVLSDAFVHRDGPPHSLMPLILQDYRFLPVFPGWIELDRIIQGAIQKAVNQDMPVVIALAEVEESMRQVVESR